MDDPVRYFRLSVSRAAEYFKFWPTPESGIASNALRVLSFGLLLPFLVVGVVIAFAQGGTRPEGRSGAVLLLLVAGLYTLIHLLTWTLVRYRLPVDAVMMPFAGISLATALARLYRAFEPPRQHIHPRFGPSS